MHRLSRIAYIAANTMNELQKQMDTISHNIANAQTAGYKKQKTSFNDLLYQQYHNQPRTETAAGRLTSPGVRIGSGAYVSQIQTVFTQGPLKQTGRPLDFALTRPKQFFKIFNPERNEIQYTRNGAFYFTPAGENEVALVTSEGYPVLDENNNPVVVERGYNQLTVRDNGTVFFFDGDGNEQVFNFGIVYINNPQAMERAGENIFRIPDETAGDAGLILTDLTGGDRAEIGLQNGALEQSNVDIGEELTDLIQTQRAYQFQARAISIADQMQGLINGIRR